MSKAIKAGWSQQDVDLFVSTHPAAQNIRFEDRAVTYDHTSSVSMSGTGFDGKTYTHEVFSTMRGSWMPPKKVVAEKTWPNKPFDGQWCPCHGSAGCVGIPQVISRASFCSCDTFARDDGTGKPAANGLLGIHRRTCSLHGSEEVTALLTREEPAVQAPTPTPKKPRKKEKRQIESLALPGVSATPLPTRRS